jgi:hypothetical protein
MLLGLIAIIIIQLNLVWRQFYFISYLSGIDEAPRGRTAAENTMTSFIHLCNAKRRVHQHAAGICFYSRIFGLNGVLANENSKQRNVTTSSSV